MPTRETETFRNLDTDSRTSTPVVFSLSLLEQKDATFIDFGCALSGTARAERLLPQALGTSLSLHFSL
jgi:hypothetical protein